MERSIKRTLFLNFICFLFFCCSCSTKEHKKVELSELMETTHQLILYKNEIIRVQRPKIDGECCKSIQLLSKNLDLIDEIECDEPYPSISICNDSLIISYLIFRSEEHSFKGGFDYYKDKYPMLGNHKLFYKLNYVFSTSVGNDISIDSVNRHGSIVTFYNNHTLICRKDIQDIFFDEYYFYSITLQNGSRSPLNFKPVNKEVYRKFFNGLIFQ